MDLLAIIVLLFVVAIVIVAVILIMSLTRVQQRKLVKSFHIDVVNRGNARSRYEVWAEDTNHALDYEFTLNGARLGRMQPVMSGSAVGQNLLASGSTKQSVVQSGKAVKAAAENVGSKVSGFNQFVGGILDTLGHLLPGSAGQSLLAVSYRLRGAQAAVDRTKRVSAQAQGMVLGRQGTSPFASVLDDDSGTTNAANPMLGSASQTTAEATGSSRPQTAFVDPGKQLQLSLVARPVGRLASEHVSFKLYSKSLEVQDTEPIVQDGVAIFKGMTGIMFYLPQIVVGVAALILVIILLAVTRVLG